jgi:hypothetical protein
VATPSKPSKPSKPKPLVLPKPSMPVSKMSRNERRKSRADAGRQQLVACAKAVAELAEYREIKAMHVSGVEHDLEIRPLLTTVIRRWSLIEPVTYITDEAAALPQGERHREHVVPVRILVDRMIMKPSECESLLSEAIVIAHVSRGEHKALGGIFVDHQTIYEMMLHAEVSNLPDLGRERYRATGILLHPVSDEHKPTRRRRSR